MNDEFYSVRRQCADVISAFSYYVDHREFAQAVQLFTEDAVFARPDLTAQGREQIAAIFAARPNTVVTRHLCGEPFFLELGKDTAKAITQVTLYNVNHDGDGLPVAKGPNALAEFHDTFERTSDGWKIAHRKGLPVLMMQH